MLDAQNAPSAPPVIRRGDYLPPDWLVPEVRLDFDLAAGRTRVRATLSVERNGKHDRALRLDGDEINPQVVRIDGEETSNWTMEDGALVIPLDGQAHKIETEVELNPAANTKLMGLYASSGLLCTQCEAEGFRRITFFPDRPDVLSCYQVRMEAVRGEFPVLLCNGDPTGKGNLPDGRHWAEWSDPFPKPCYLFALVAGDLEANHDSFITRSGRKVDLAIWVAERDLPKTAHAMAALKNTRATIASEIVQLERQLRHRREHLVHVDATITLLDPSVSVEGIPNKRPRKRIKLFRQGELGRMILDAIRQADGEPMSTSEIVGAVLEAGGHDEGARPTMGPRVRGNLAYLQRRRKIAKQGNGKLTKWIGRQ